MTKQDSTITFYGYPLSGHTHRVELMLSMLGLRYAKVEIDLGSRQQKSPEFLQKNRFGQVPVIDDNGAVISDSAAILVYLAERYGAGAWLPADPLGRAEVQRWLSVAAGQLAQGPALARVGLVFKKPVDMAQAHAVAAQLFATMDAVLAKQDYLAAPRLTIADLALYAYTAHAPEGGIDLAPYPHLQDWLARIEAAPGFVAMRRSNTGLWAA
ncbi:glutathione S-transferase family protein [Janthinobacterium agaricidamnosum]|uniref:Glutathione S-transferase, C-terminal domain protein n=1 Tax=Janthinobacterium agaricidamnosum NBRC 102515 = DSM 9628 TaxID=1349767 RepID=W0V4Z9_9BURK|nr:glutathione S-transferase [Janthinobacterium agaricidamnosum]CDG83909.1 glutathione S-transferase, C-terminal domain protein [Janthinobacterium agaricidamnosum NBRC 102515 = DSM 9628]